MPELIGNLKLSGVLKSPSITKALQDIDRADFVPDDVRDCAYDDVALPIGEGQTISQPFTVVFMLELLQPTAGKAVLEIGYGSGWQTAILAHIVGDEGRVHAFEIILNLCELGKKNLAKYPHLAQRVSLRCRSGAAGCPDAAPFDRIICAAEVADVPGAWREQLSPGGRMVYPRSQAIVLEIKNTDGSFIGRTFPGFVFVPFRE